MKKILERGKSPEFSPEMQNAVNEAAFSKTLALAVNVKGRDIAAPMAGLPSLAEMENMAGNGFTEKLLGFAVDASLNSSNPTANITLLCKDSQSAEDANKMLGAAQVAIRNGLKKDRHAPSEVSDMIDSIKLSVSGAKVQCSLQTNPETLSKLVKEAAKWPEQDNPTERTPLIQGGPFPVRAKRLSRGSPQGMELHRSPTRQR